MTTEWKDLTTPQEVAEAQADGWEIEHALAGVGAWEPWSGSGWAVGLIYRGRPKQPKTRTVTSVCWRQKEDGRLWWGSYPDYDGWQRFPAGDITGEVEE